MPLLQSTRQKLPSKVQEFLARAPGDKKTHDDFMTDSSRKAKDITVNDKRVFPDEMLEEVEGENGLLVGFDFKKYSKAIKDKIQALEISEDDSKYLSHLMTYLTMQKFLALPTVAMKKHFEAISSTPVMPAFSEYKINMVSNDGKPYVELEWTCPFLDEEEGEEFTRRVLKYCFFPDQTMQLLMDNPDDKYKDVWQSVFEMPISMSTERRQALDPKEPETFGGHDDPYNLLGMGQFIPANPNLNIRKFARAIEANYDTHEWFKNFRDTPANQPIYDELSSDTRNTLDALIDKVQARDSSWFERIKDWFADVYESVFDSWTKAKDGYKQSFLGWLNSIFEAVFCIAPQEEYKAYARNMTAYVQQSTQAQQHHEQQQKDEHGIHHNQEIGRSSSHVVYEQDLRQVSGMPNLYNVGFD